MDDARIDAALGALERVDELGHIGDLVAALSAAPADAPGGVLAGVPGRAA